MAASARDKKFHSALRNILARNFDAVFLQSGQFTAAPDSAELAVLDACNVERVDAPRVIFLCKDARCLPCDFAEGTSAVAVVDSSNAALVRAVSGIRLPAVTCGLSPKDTITLSSIGEDSAVINLQRGITCLDGSVAEPQEIPVSLCAMPDRFVLMSAAAVFLLSGNIARLPEAII